MHTYMLKKQSINKFLCILFILFIYTTLKIHYFALLCLSYHIDQFIIFTKFDITQKSMKRNHSGLYFNLAICVVIGALIMPSIAQISIQSYKDSWNTLDEIEGQLHQTHTMFTNPKCNPCDYLLSIYEQQIILTIVSPLNNQINSISLKIISSSEQDGFAFDEKTFDLSNKMDNKVAESITRYVTDWLTWQYEFTLPYEGIIIKGTQQDNHYLTAFVSVFFAMVSFILLPLRSNFLKTLTNMIYIRTSFVSMVIISQNLHFLMIYYAAITIKYLLWEQSYLVKFIWYGVFMSALSILIVHTILFYSTMQKKFNSLVSKKQWSLKTKSIILMSIFFFGIIIFDLIFLFIQKNIFLYYYFSLGFIFQVGYSIKKKVYPHLTTVIYSFFISYTLLILANLMPMFKFQQTTRFDMVILLCYQIAMFLIASIAMKFFIGLQNKVEFQCASQANAKDLSTNEQDAQRRSSQVEIVSREV